MILAQYTIRSKQDYIFKTNRVLEIVGASENIARIWGVLFQVAKNNNLKFETVENQFQMASITKRFKAKELNFVELFQGGGNETILFDSMESYVKLNRAFSYVLLKEYPGMIPMAVAIEASGDYARDYRELMQEAERKKNIMEPHWDMFTVPFAMIDRSTFQPYHHVVRIGNSEVRMSDESYSKYHVGKKLRDDHEDIKLFDKLITQKGKESLLAVVHADGNNMGAKIMGMLQGETDYDKAVICMREFTATTADCFETKGLEALVACQKKLIENNPNIEKSSLAFRKIIGSGDDMTFVCNGRFVMDYVKAYLDSVQNYDGKWNYSSCAGICIFHSHYPFSRAYSIAEQACDDGAKKKVHIVDENGTPQVVEQGWVDFHFIHSGISGDLDEIRKSQGTASCLARPWLVTGESNKDKLIYRYEDLIKLRDVFQKFSVSRTAIKTIGSAFERSETAAKKELLTLYGHTENLYDEIKNIYSNEKDFLRALYDLGEIYDLWYGEVK